MRLEELVGLFTSTTEWETLGRVLGAMGTASNVPADDLATASAVYAKFRRAQQLLEQLKDLASWAELPTAERREFRADQLALTLLAEGSSFTEASEMGAHARKNAPGAPPKRRAAGILALELKHRKPKLTWMQVAIQCCNCGKSKHTPGCMQVVRQEVIALEKLLRKYAIHPWDQVKL